MDALQTALRNTDGQVEMLLVSFGIILLVGALLTGLNEVAKRKGF